MTRSFTEIQQAIAWQLKESIGEDRFDMWFGSPDAIGIADGAVVVTVADDLALSFVRQQFTKEIRLAVDAVVCVDTAIRFHANVEPAATPKQKSLFSTNQLAAVGIQSSEPDRSSRRAKRLTRPDQQRRRQRNVETSQPSTQPGHQTGSTVASRPTHSIDSFQFGPQNRLLETAVREMLAEPGKFNPLVVHGPVGCGKSHLVSAIVAKARQSGRYRRCVNVTAEQFTTAFIEGLNERKLTDFRAKFRNLDLVVIDDIQFLAGKQATIIEFQNTIEALLRSGKQILLTSDRPPGELRFADDSLFNRLSSGLTCPLRYPDVDGRMEIIRQFSAGRNLNLSTPVQTLLARQITRDVRLLHGAINRLKAAWMVNQGDVTVEMAHEHLADLFQSQSPLVSLDRIEQAVCDVCGVKPDELRSSKRIKPISTARMLAMWLSRKYTSAGLAEIGKHYGGRSHSTVVAAEKKINEMLSNNSSVPVNHRSTSISSAMSRLKNRLDVG